MKFVAETLLRTIQIFVLVNIEKKNRGLNAKNSMIWFEAGMDRAGREAGTSWPRAKHFPSSFSLNQQVHIFVQFQDRHIDT